MLALEQLLAARWQPLRRGDLHGDLPLRLGPATPKVHLRTLIPMMVSGLFGTFCILAVNAWWAARPSGQKVDHQQASDSVAGDSLRRG